MIYIPPSLPQELPAATREVRTLHASAVMLEELTAKIARMVAPFARAEQRRRRMSVIRHG